MAGTAAQIVETLARCGLESDEQVVFQSTRAPLYEAAFARLQALGLVYGCTCSRKDIEDVVSAQSGGLVGVYPGTCSSGAALGKPLRAYRVRVPDEQLGFVDRAAVSFSHNLKHGVGDFVIRRADGLFAYQLAVVVDDAEQGITDVVRGADLLDNTPRQIFLQRALGLPTPRYLHVPLVFSATGDKLSKQTGATAIDDQKPIEALHAAALHLGLSAIHAASVDKFLGRATERWRARQRDS